jgi:hypothetical protein
MNCEAQKPKYDDKPIPLANITTNATLNVTPTLNLVAPITIVPTLIAPVYASIRPEINLDVGGVTVNFSGDGVRITQPGSKTIQPDPTYDPRERPPDTVNVDNSTENSTACDLTPVLDKIKEIKEEVEECCDRYHPFSSLPPDKISTTVLGSGNSGNVQLPARCFKVTLQITSDLSKIENQAGDNSPTVYHAGWASFDRGGGQAERHPIDYRYKSYEPPSRGAERFSWKMRKDYTCNVVCYSSTK